MENASKALLMSAAILLVILLIAFGMRIFRSTSSSSDELNVTMQTTAAAQFNSKFTQYIGTGKSRAQVIALLNVAIANNSKNTHKVKINGKTSNSDLTALINGVSEGDYKIEVKTNDSEGYITEMKYS